MAKGIKTGGRVAGTPNKRTLEAMEKLKELGCDPIEGMARIAMDESNSIELRAKMYSELAPYIFPKRKAMDINSNDSGLTIVINRGDSDHKSVEIQSVADESNNNLSQ